MHAPAPSPTCATYPHDPPPNPPRSRRVTSHPPLPGRTLRIGVTGTRTLDPGQLPRLHAQVTEVLRAAAALAKTAGVTQLELLSPLAEGADRLVAECALDPSSDLKFELICPMPFARQEYEKDFLTPANLDAFNTIITNARPRILELDGKRTASVTHPDGTSLTPAEQIRADHGEEARAYEAVGRLIVRNCDLLIAIWDGLPGEGRGGTADTVRHAISFGPPVVWIHATTAIAPCWVEELRDLRHNAAQRTADGSLKTYLTRLLHAPKPHHDAREHGLLHWFGHLVGTLTDGIANLRRRRPPASHLMDFLCEEPNPVWGPWLVHGWFMRVMGGDLPGSRPHAPDDPAARRWFDRFQPADDRAGECAKRYRSSYVWVFAFGAIALSSAAVSLGFADHPWVKIAATTAEFIVLVLIGGLVIADGRLGWQRRAIEYRLVAELCRKQQALAPLGWVVPRATAWATGADEPGPQPDMPHNEPISWVSWLFSAWLRDAPLPTGTIDSVWVERARDAAQHDLLDNQIDYHTIRRAQTDKAAKSLVRLGEWSFLLLVALVVWKLCLLPTHEDTPDPALHHLLLLLGLAGAILPAFSAAFVGIRAYAELEMLAEQSDAMLKVMWHAKGQIAALDTKAPLSSQTLGVALAAVATLMLEDLEGWARLFRGKVLDA